MKKFTFLFCAAVFAVSVVSAQSVPDSLSYQAVVHNSSGALVANQNIGMDIQILQGAATGNVVYEETQTPATNANGLISIVIGGGGPASFKAINWSAGPYYLKTQIDPAGGTAYSITATNQIMSVPYALHAAVADTAAKAPPVTLDQAYHAGDTITADNGAVTIGGTDGFLISGTQGAGATIGNIADNTPVMYFNPNKAAFRAGAASNGNWNDAKIGYFSTATGFNTVASGITSTALGYNAVASTDFATALGYKATASGRYSTAIGNYVSTGGQDGSFIIGDYSPAITTNSSTQNQFTARFAGGYRLFTNDIATVGVQLAAGGNSWIVISDSTKKENFLPVNENEFLAKINKMHLTSWNYKGQDPKTFRHYGPMAQDFYNAFGKDQYGTIGNDTTINQADMMGVTFIAVQGLIRENDSLKAEIAKLKSNSIAEHTALKAEVAKLETEMAALKTLAVAALKEKSDVAQQ